VVGRNLDMNTMRLQYLETLKDVGTAPSTKIVVPMELGGLLGGLQALPPGLLRIIQRQPATAAIRLASTRSVVDGLSTHDESLGNPWAGFRRIPLWKWPNCLL